MNQLYINKVSITGRVGRVNFHTTKSNKEICNISIAVRIYQGNQANSTEKYTTNWHNIVIYNNYFVERAKKLTTGDFILISGELKTNEWTDASGATRITTQIVLGDYSGGDLQIITKAPDKKLGQEGENVDDDIITELGEFFSMETKEDKSSATKKKRGNGNKSEQSTGVEDDF